MHDRKVVLVLEADNFTRNY